MRARLLFLLAPLLLLAAPLPAAAGDEPSPGPAAEDLEWKELEPGIDYTTWETAGSKKAKTTGEGGDGGPVAAHVLRINLDGTGLLMRSLRPLGRSQRIEQIVALFHKGNVDVRAALNGDYFDFTQSEKDPLGLHVSGGQLLWFPANTSTLFMDDSGTVHMDRLTIETRVTGTDLEIAVDGANRKAGKAEAVLFSGYYREKTVAQPECITVVLDREELGTMVNSEVELTVAEVFAARNARSLKPLQLALTVCGERRELVRPLEVGARLMLLTTVKGFSSPILEAISGGPRVLRRGEVVQEISKEGFSLALRFYIPQKHPRSAVGISADGKQIFMLAAEGRSKKSSGLSADETARLLKAAGASEAMLFDGGGSVALYHDGGFLNRPLRGRNYTKRDIANTLAIIRKQQKSGGKGPAAP